jgi:hypothetical protein
MSLNGRALPPAAQSVLQTEGNLMEAIKIVRAEEGLDLKEAKDRVETWIATQPVLKAQLATRGKEARVGYWILAIVFAAGCVAAISFLMR